LPPNKGHRHAAQKTYIRVINGREETMVQIKPNEFVNIEAVLQLRLISAVEKDQICLAVAA
jgi:hypothetical protein